MDKFGKKEYEYIGDQPRKKKDKEKEEEDQKEDSIKIYGGYVVNISNHPQANKSPGINRGEAREGGVFQRYVEDELKRQTEEKKKETKEGEKK